MKSFEELKFLSFPVVDSICVRLNFTYETRQTDNCYGVKFIHRIFVFIFNITINIFYMFYNYNNNSILFLNK